jgi:hypothetical protein
VGLFWDKDPLDEVRRRRRPKGVAVIIEVDEDDFAFENLTGRFLAPGRFRRPAFEGLFHVIVTQVRPAIYIT